MHVHVEKICDQPPSGAALKVGRMSTWRAGLFWSRSGLTAGGAAKVSKGSSEPARAAASMGAGAGRSRRSCSPKSMRSSGHCFLATGPCAAETPLMPSRTPYSTFQAFASHSLSARLLRMALSSSRNRQALGVLLARGSPASAMLLQTVSASQSSIMGTVSMSTTTSALQRSALSTLVQDIPDIPETSDSMPVAISKTSWFAVSIQKERTSQMGLAPSPLTSAGQHSSQRYQLQVRQSSTASPLQTNFRQPSQAPGSALQGCNMWPAGHFHTFAGELQKPWMRLLSSDISQEERPRRPAFLEVTSADATDHLRSARQANAGALSQCT
mmetsp:Transcript_6301/g.14398  ORF Transcript_6301/g.14398 Transcript_6301/m.14398 type:complete len:327 (+) Transcript_6301:71-1051(+)